MIYRAALLCASLIVGAGAAQLPEYTQQYVQRLGGAVDALRDVTADFDASAKSAGLTREAALAQMTGTPFLEARQQDMRRTFARYDSLSQQLITLQGAPAGARTLAILRGPDREVAAAAYAAFRPALPATAEGLLFGGAGFLGAGALISGLGRVFKRRRPA